MSELDGKVAIVAGAGPGIGRSCALALARAGADVALAARREGPLTALAEEVAKETGRRTAAIPTDMGELDSCRALVARTVEELGRVDHVVNVATRGTPRAGVREADWSQWRDAFELNVVGTLEICARAADAMIEQGAGGTIVQIGALGMHTLMPNIAGYTATKSAMTQASKTMARELGRHGIRVNLVTPGYTTGAELDAMWQGIAEKTGQDPEEVSKRAAKTAALRRHVSPEDIAEAVLFLSTPRSQNITGTDLMVDAGQFLGP